MPVGLIFMRWTEVAGNEILAKYPEDLSVPDRTLMQIFHTHEYSGDPGMISLMVGTTNIASYYTGPESNYCVLIVLGLGEDPDVYEGSLADVAQILLQKLDKEEYLNLIPSLYKHIRDYPFFNYEQQFIYLYQNDIKRWIITRLRAEGVVTKSQLITWLKQTYPNGFGDIDLTLFEFVQKDFIQMLSVKDERSVNIFLLNDLVMFRKPPFNIIKGPRGKGLPKNFEATYLNSAELFFQNYQPSEEDNVKVINILKNPQTYELFNLLRDSVLTKEAFEKLKKTGIPDVENIIKSLLDAQMIMAFQDIEGNGFYALLTDFFIEALIPEYILAVLQNYHENRTKSNQVLKKYLDLLEEAYINSFP